jgi:coenzyme F420 hydrogenase subunit delta
MKTDGIHSKQCLILGCGNPLFGDDGFGPQVIKHLEDNYALPGHTACVDAGTGVREILFDIILSPQKPRRIIVIDASQQDAKIPGHISEIDVDGIALKKTADFSLHQFPTTNMLKELKTHTDIDIRILVVQPEFIPDEIAPGLSKPVEAAVSSMCSRIISILEKEPS